MTVESTLADRWFRVDDALAESMGTEVSIWDCFDPLTPGLDARPVTDGGRAAAWFVRAGAFYAVLRQYRRGGVVAKFIKSSYLWTGFANTRSRQEFDLLLTLWRLGLSVPRPLGAAAWRHGLVYRAALLTERIPHAKPLAHCLDLETWRRAGAAIADMHQLGVWHADLNVYNILFDDQAKVWLIDFDRSRLMAFLTPAQRAQNLSRLLRSLKKLSLTHERECWLALSDAYQEHWRAFEILE